MIRLRAKHSEPISEYRIELAFVCFLPPTNFNHCFDRSGRYIVRNQNNILASLYRSVKVVWCYAWK